MKKAAQCMGVCDAYQTKLLEVVFGNEAMRDCVVGVMWSSLSKMML